VNECPDYLNSRLADVFEWEGLETIRWLSPLKADDFAEYYDEAFLEKLGLHGLRTPLKSFWPASGPRWDGLAITGSGKAILVEAKAYIEEAVDYRSKASSDDSLEQINRSLAETKAAFGANKYAPWESPFYQCANRLAHLYFLAGLNNVDAYLLFLYFADASDVPGPCSTQQWEGAIRLTQRCLGLGANRFQRRIGHLILPVNDMLSNRRAQPTLPSGRG
jgi:hypothetical protein